MNREQLRKLFPNASRDFLALHGLSDPAPPAPIVERGAGVRPLAKGKAKKADTGRFLVLVKSYRRRLLDEDNLCEKYAVDCCRYAGLLPSDAPGCTSISVSQEKVARKEDERTEIQIIQTP